MNYARFNRRLFISTETEKNAIVGLATLGTPVVLQVTPDHNMSFILEPLLVCTPRGIIKNPRAYGKPRGVSHCGARVFLFRCVPTA